MKKILAFLMCIALLVSGCRGTFGGEKLNVDSDEMQFAQPQAGDKVAIITTSEGVIKVRLFEDLAPKAVNNFIFLAQSGYYNDVTFHRAIEDFLIQAGSPDGSANGGTSAWGLEFEDEFSDLLHHYNGALSMANHGEDTNGSQFFFVTSPIGQLDGAKEEQMSRAGWRSRVIEAYKQAGGLPALDYRYTVFGQIYEGLDVAYSISKAKTDENDRPKKDIVIESVEIQTAEQTAE